MRVYLECHVPWSLRVGAAGSVRTLPPACLPAARKLLAALPITMLGLKMPVKLVWRCAEALLLVCAEDL